MQVTRRLALEWRGGAISEVEVTDCLLCCVITLSIKREIAVSIFFDFFAYIFGYRLSMM